MAMCDTTIIDALVTVQVTREDMARGGDIKVTVPSLPKGIFIRIPAATTDGQRFRIPHHGLACPDGRRGDLIVMVTAA